jgi:peptidoglycan lytic transglycosylase
MKHGAKAFAAGWPARRGHATVAALALLLAMLGACGRTPVRPNAQRVPVGSDIPAPAGPDSPALTPGKPKRRGNPPFYEVMGKRYHVLPSGEGYHERGVASWYGSEFHGRLTASGEPYDMNAMTAAHKTLPLPSYARVTNLRNGRSIIVRINDRGPFVRNRILDLSYAAAQALDIATAGTGIVDIETVAPDADANAAPASATSPGGAASATGAGALADASAMLVPDVAASADPPLEERSLYVQVGAFGEPFNAERLRQHLAGLGFDNVAVVPDIANERPLYRVRLGPLADVAAYDRLVDRLHAHAIDDIYLTLD